MIIPPDPDKDPALFSPSSSTPSLLPPPTESSSSVAINRAERAHRNPAFGYPFVASDDLGAGYAGEALPPYEGRRLRGRERRTSDNGDGFHDPERIRHPIVIPPGPHSSASDISTHLPIHSPPSSQAGRSSTTKLWESSFPSSSRPRRRCLPSLPIPPGLGKWWARWRRYVQAALVVLLIGIGVMIGLLVGLSRRKQSDQQGAAQSPYGMPGDGRRTTSWNTTGESLNITYIPSRDGPGPDDGNMTECNLFTPLNSPNPFDVLFTPFPDTSLSLATFTFPFANITNFTLPMANQSSVTFPLTNRTFSLVGDFAITATGLGASGTVEMVGSDTSGPVVNGTEGVVEVDVIVQYSSEQDLDSTMRVCKMTRGDGGVGVGIYTPIVTDGKVDNAYMINPMLLSSFHVVIRLPPSAVTGPISSSIYLPSMTFTLDRMSIRFGNMQNIVDFGNISVMSGRGGLVAGYVAAKNVDIITSQNSVRGLWNISESISVNNTGGSIISEVILFDPNLNTTDPSLVLPTSNLIERSNPVSNTSLASALGSIFSAPKLTPTHAINTQFFTSSGFVSVAYLHQPPRTALTSMISTGGGELEVSMHPNFVGPFIIKDMWGAIRLPPPKPFACSDPMHWNRTRLVSLGEVEAPAGSTFVNAGLNESVIDNAGGLLMGAAYWNWGNSTQSVGPVTPSDVQDGEEGNGSELAVLGSWGDVRVSFDGT